MFHLVPVFKLYNYLKWFWNGLPAHQFTFTPAGMLAAGISMRKNKVKMYTRLNMLISQSLLQNTNYHYWKSTKTCFKIFTKSSLLVSSFFKVTFQFTLHKNNLKSNHSKPQSNILSHFALKKQMKHFCQHILKCLLSLGGMTNVNVITNKWLKEYKVQPWLEHTKFTHVLWTDGYMKLIQVGLYEKTQVKILVLTNYINTSTCLVLFYLEMSVKCFLFDLEADFHCYVWSVQFPFCISGWVLLLLQSCSGIKFISSELL